MQIADNLLLEGLWAKKLLEYISSMVFSGNVLHTRTSGNTLLPVRLRIRWEYHAYNSQADSFLYCCLPVLHFRQTTR